MGFFDFSGVVDFIGNKFKKNKELGILNVSSLINIPGRRYFKDDLDSIREIDKYYYKYYNLLKVRKRVLTEDIKIDTLQKDIIMNTELLVKNFLETNYEDLSKIDLKLYYLKLYLYLDNLNVLKKKLIIRLISLKELEDKLVIPCINRETLNIEINNLSITLLNLLNQLSALNIERNTILDNISITNIESNEELLKEKYEETLRLYKHIKGNKLDVKDILGNLVYMERELEIYAYKNKHKIDLYDKELDSISNNKVLSKREYLLNKIKRIELEYTIFDLYGKNIINNENLYKLYKNKFDILALDINYNFNSDSYIQDEYSIYLSIIQYKFNNLLTGNNDNVKYVFKDDYLKAINAIKKILKNNNNEYDLYDILTNNYKLRTLLSFDSKDGYEYLLNSYKFELLFRNSSEPDLDVLDYCYDSIYYESRNYFVSLKDALELQYAKDYYVSTSKVRSISHLFMRLEIECFIDLLNLYKLYRVNNDNELYYKIPEGIVSLAHNSSNPSIYNYTFSETKCGIRELCKDKIIIMPSSLSELDNYFFEGIGANGVILNDGLKEVFVHKPFNVFREHGINITSKDNILFVSIPSSLEDITFSERDRKIKTLKFDNFKNSKILNNRDKLCKLFSSLLYIEFIPKRNTVELKISFDKIIIDNYIIDCNLLAVEGVATYISTNVNYRGDGYLENYKCVFDKSISYYVNVNWSLNNDDFSPMVSNHKEFLIINYEGTSELISLFVDNLYKKIEEVTGYKIEENKNKKFVK